MENEVQRPLAHYSANIWNDVLTSISSKPNIGYETLEEKHATLKEIVKESFMVSTNKPIENVKFIDALCRLGVSYHFEIDIVEQLEHFFNDLYFNKLIRHDGCDLYTLGLVFQVSGNSVSNFLPFKDDDGKFKGDLSGMLSLYEASQWSTHGEEILDEALAFSRFHLKEILSSQCSPNLAIRIKNALKHPYHKGITRIETRQYISYYEAEEDCDKVLLEFAKVDFNLLQKLHREELACVARWYNEMEIETKIPFTRHRIAEAYLWSLGAYFEPRYSQARVQFATAIILFTAFDDMYDAYGTVEELEIFTDALLKWLPDAPNGIPESMKYIYRMIVDFYDKLEDKLEKEGKSGCGFHLKKSLKASAIGYMKEAKWMKEDYIATFDEYKENGIVSAAYYPLIAMTFARMGDDVAKLDAFEWLSSNPKIRIASELICRFTDDVSSYEFERKREHVATGIDCYMKQYGVSKEKAVEAMQHIVSDAWKEMNQELMRPHACAFPLLMRVFNLSRVIDVFYRYDAYTHPEYLKGHIVSLFIESIPI